MVNPRADTDVSGRNEDLQARFLVAGCSMGKMQEMLRLAVLKQIYITPDLHYQLMSRGYG